MLACLEMAAEMKTDPAMTRSIFADAIKAAKAPPEYALKVLRRYRVGSLGDGKWCPKPGEVHMAIVEAVAADMAAVKRQRRLDDQLAARARREADRCPRRELPEVRALLEQLRDIPDRARPAIWRPPTEAEAREWLEAHEGGVGLAPVTVSDRLTQKLSELSGGGSEAETAKRPRYGFQNMSEAAE